MADWPQADGQLTVTYGADSSSITGIYIANTTTGIPGGTLVAGGTKGGWRELVNGTRGAAAITVGIPSTVTAPAFSLLDIGIGAAGNEVALLPNILVHTVAANRTGWEIMFPVAIPENSRLSARIATSSAVQVQVGVTIMLHGNGFAAIPGGNVVQDIGTVLSASPVSATGSPIYAPSAANQWATPSPIGTTTRPITSTVIGLQSQSTTWVYCRHFFELMVFSGGTYTALLQFPALAAAWDAQFAVPFIGPLPVGIPADRDLYIRQRNSAGSGSVVTQRYTAIIYGVS